MFEKQELAEEELHAHLHSRAGQTHPGYQGQRRAGAEEQLYGPSEVADQVKKVAGTRYL